MKTKLVRFIAIGCYDL